ncbi:MAG: hypothetical protein ACREL2_01280 [Gemmatimonadales bacterium]
MSITSLRTLAALTAALCLTPWTAATAQQAAGPVRPPAVSMDPAATSPATASVPAPHPSTLFDPVEPTRASDRASERSFLPSSGGDRHTITVSTLTLVLAVVILVLLVAR